MAGGFHDHIGGGFHRYSTDANWLLPHFEKMLYDNAQLMGLYADAYEITKQPRYRAAVADIVRWVDREMRSPEGGFYSALDSGEVGKEGEAYIWSTIQLREAVDREDADYFAEIYQFSDEGNFREESTGERVGKNIPHLLEPIKSIAEKRDLDPVTFANRLTAIRQRLLEERLTWPQPHKDDKILASWNGLMIGALAKAGRLLDEPAYIDAARSAANFIAESMMVDGTVMRSYRSGEARLPGYLDDYVYLADGMLELYEAAGNQEYLDRAIELASQFRDEFEDRLEGGFFQSGKSHEELLVRSKFLGSGGNLPNANGVAARVLMRLAELTGDQEYRQSAERTLEAFAFAMDQQAHTNEELLIATGRSIQQQSQGASKLGTARLKPIDVATTLSVATNDPNQFELSVRIHIDNGFHLYAANVENESVIPTVVTVVPQNGLEVGQVQQPDSQSISDPGLGKKTEIYKGTIEFKIPLKIQADRKTLPEQFELRIDFQACDDSRCLRPQRLNIVVPAAMQRGRP